MRSPTRRPADPPGGVIAVLFACASVFLTGGVVFGMSALYPVLYSERVLADKCEGTCPATDRKCCDAQLLGYTLMTTAALLPSDAFIVVYGELVDRAGPRKAFLVGQSFAYVGLALLALNTRLGSNDFLWLASFFSLGAAGPGVFFSILILGEKFPRLQPIITALTAATFDGSAISFYIFNLLYFAAGWRFESVAIVWLGLAMAVGGATYAHLPSWKWLLGERVKAKHAAALASYESDIGGRSQSGSSFGGLLDEGAFGSNLPSPLPSPRGDNGASSPGTRWKQNTIGVSEDAISGGMGSGSGTGLQTLAEPLLASPEAPADPFSTGSALQQLSEVHTPTAPQLSGGTALTVADRNAGGSALALEGAPSPRDSGTHRLLNQMMRTDTLLLLATMAVANLKASYFIVSFSADVRALFSETIAQRLDLVFNIGFPIGALIASPFTSILLRRFRNRPDIYFGVALCGINLFGLATLIIHPVPQMIGALLFGPTRTLLWSSYFHFMTQPRRYSRSLACAAPAACPLHPCPSPRVHQTTFRVAPCTHAQRANARVLQFAHCVVE